MRGCDGSVVLQDLYVDRPLPYLIGSKAFMEQDDVGLGDLSSDGEYSDFIHFPLSVLGICPPLSCDCLVCAEMSVDSDRELESGDEKESVVR